MATMTRVFIECDFCPSVFDRSPHANEVASAQRQLAAARGAGWWRLKTKSKTVDVCPHCACALTGLASTADAARKAIEAAGRQVLVDAVRRLGKEQAEILHKMEVRMISGDEQVGRQKLMWCRNYRTARPGETKCADCRNSHARWWSGRYACRIQNDYTVGAKMTCDDAKAKEPNGCADD